MKSAIKSSNMAICLKNGGYAASLELRKLYTVVDDPEADSLNLIRVVDESGEDYLYPQDFFIRVALPKNVEDAILAAS